ncbi:hypothetical protein M5K25_018278 [Dendrobium thyrsiflorum]|uniref:Uncharacterized protein n=1 Tax=Dendrobium thyrsiflorum TaxID=117978 RepID=A0ABD0UHI6_DENTH
MSKRYSLVVLCKLNNCLQEQKKNCFTISLHFQVDSWVRQEGFRLTVGFSEQWINGFGKRNFGKEPGSTSETKSRSQPNSPYKN